MSPADRDVLTSLPKTRPTRRSAKRGDAPGVAAPAPAPSTSAKPRATAPAKPGSTTRGSTPPKRKPTAAAAAKATPKARPKAAAAKAATPKRAAPSPAAERPVATPAPPSGGWAASPADSRDGGTGALLGTAARAVGELAQIGLAFGGQALKQALSKLPKP